jgi:DNA-directed RNA polymerase delta subunit
MEPQQDWLSIREVAHRLSVSTWQVRKWLDADQFDEIAVFSKKLTRISKGAYDRFVAKNQRVSA